MFGAGGKSARSWTAPVLWRFDHARGMNNGRNLVLSLLTFGRKAIEDYRSPRPRGSSTRARLRAIVLECGDGVCAVAAVEGVSRLKVRFVEGQYPCISV
jgi:hypothetical protein